MAETNIIDELSAPRRKALAELCEGTYAGTAELLAHVVDESRHAHAWRPARAMLALTVAELNPAEGRVWMTAAEFKDWRDAARVSARRRGWAGPDEDLGIKQAHAADLCRQDRIEKRRLTIFKPIALACAHHALGFEKPVEQGDVDAFRAWYFPRFSNIDRVAEYLGMSNRWLKMRLEGFEMKDGERVDRAPEGYVLRALDYLWRVGPICPYGNRGTVEIWPGQKVVG